MRNPLSRREVLKFGAYTTVGGVLTPGVSTAQAIVTDTRGISAADIVLDADGRIPPYQAHPEAPGRHLVVVVVSGFTGNSEHQKDVVRRFAQAGFFAISPELYHRAGGMHGKSFQEMGRIAGQITRAQYLGDVRRAAEHATRQPRARADPLGVTGFCNGGALALHFAAEYPGVAAVLPWYGHLRRSYPDAPGVDAFSLADRIKAPVLGLYGEADTGIPVDDVRRFEAELRRRNPAVEFVLYPGAPHAFFSDDRPQAYRKEAAEDAWRRCLAFLDRHLRG